LAEYIGERLARESLEALLPTAKAELDSIDEEAEILRVEFNDTNRPDLWSAAGLARQLKAYLGRKAPCYDFVSAGPETVPSGNRRIDVDPLMEGIRPYIAGFIAEGEPVSDDLLQAMVQSQEKLCTNYGRKRRSVAMGIYSADRISFPVYYRGADPDDTLFVPLGAASMMSLRKILEDHPKGKEYGHIIAAHDRYPYLEDSRGDCLSLPPVINSDHCGAVTAGEERLFIELTGTDMDTVLTAASIIACDLADTRFSILPVRVVYPYETPHGRELTTPYHFQGTCSVGISQVCKVLGESLPADDIPEYLAKMGLRATIERDTVSVSVPPYRNDFMHGVDIIEDIMIGRGVETFDPILPDEPTIGRLSPMEQASRRIRDIMIGLGYQEMLYNYLSSRADLLEKMGLGADDAVEIENPMTESYQMVRNSILPNLLTSESVSRNAQYPHRIFEIGHVVSRRIGGDGGTITQLNIGILVSDKAAGFNEINAHIAALMHYLSLTLSQRDIPDSRFIPGRCVEVVRGGKRCGVLGELHPRILEEWSVGMPCAAAEICITKLLRRELGPDY